MNPAPGPRLLLLMTTATYRANAFMSAAARLGVPVIVGSDQRQVLSASNPAGHLVLDFTDPQRALETILETARRAPLSGIVAADDDGVVLAARAAEALGLAQHSRRGVEIARDKGRLRQSLAEAGVRTPRFRTFDGARDDLPALSREVAYPCVIKPVFLSGSRGVMRVDREQEFVGAVERLMRIVRPREVARLGGERWSRVLVEAYIPGAEFAVEGLVTAGRLRVLAIYDKPDPLEGPCFEETIYVTPSRQPAAMQQELIAEVQRVIDALELAHGPVHAELRVNDQGAWLIEIAPRSIGGRCSRTLRFAGERTLEDLLLRHALGLPGHDTPRIREAAGVMMLPIPRAGVLRSVEGREAALAVAGIEELQLTIPPGGRVEPPPEGSRYLGFLFSRSERPETAERALRQAHRLLRFEISGVSTQLAVPPG